MQAAAACVAMQLQMVDLCGGELCREQLACTSDVPAPAGNYGAPNGFWFDPWAQDPPLMVGHCIGQSFALSKSVHELRSGC